MIPSLLQWFTDPENWVGPDGIPARLWEHLWYTGATMVAASLVAIPLGLWVGHTGRARWLVSLANSARAVPTLGLLLAASLWLGPKLPGDLAYIVPSIAVLADSNLPLNASSAEEMPAISDSLLHCCALSPPRRAPVAQSTAAPPIPPSPTSPATAKRDSPATAAPRRKRR